MKKNNALLLAPVYQALCCILALPVSAQETDWFDAPEHGFSLNFSLGQFEDSAQLSSFSATVPLFAKAEMYGRYSELNGDEQNETGTSIYFQTDPAAQFSLGLGYETGNRDDHYEVEDWLALAGVNFGPWYFEANIMRGDVYTTPYNLGEDLVAALRERDLLSAKRSGLGATLAYYGATWATRVSFRDYDLERKNEADREDILAILNSLGYSNNQQILSLLASRSGRQHWRRLWLGLYSSNQQYYRQVSHIADQEVSADIYFDYQKLSFSTGYYWYQSDQFDEQVSSLYGSLGYPFSDHISAEFLLSASDQEDSLYGELGLGLRW